MKRIVFLDSNYNWDNTRYGRKLADWLDSSSENKLVVACYDDYNALLDGKHFVSKTGGTFYRSNMMLEYLKGNMQTAWSESEHENLIRCESANGSVQFLMRKNPEQRIWHTVLVEKNGFIHSILFGSPFENKGYKFMGDNAYNDFIQPAMSHPHIMRIPPRHKDALTGSEFIEKVKNMSLAERETAIYEEIANGNIPDSFRIATTIKTTEKDAAGNSHTVEFLVLPDFLAIGSDDDFVRVPMLPSTAQRIANLFNATLPTRKLSDLIYRHSIVKLVPMPMTPDSTMTTVPIFYKHHKNIEKERLAEGQPLSALIAGHKKDIVITNRLTEPGRVFIYGWHYPDGRPIQPLSGVHGAGYVDYSHGVRLINREIMIDGKEVEFKASAAVPRIYRMKFRRDLFMDLQKVAKSVDKKGKKKDKEESEIPIEDLEMFENIAYVMAQHADPKNVPADIMEWLEQFQTFSIYQILPAILELWNLNEETQSKAKKNLDQVAGS